MIVFTIQGSDTYLYLDSGLGYRFENSRIPFFGFVTANPLLKLDPEVDSLLGNNDEKFIFSVSRFRIQMVMISLLSIF
ncbi:MAG: hypothetical protein R3B93_05250 [Bacteroidia bacterium]